MTSLLRMNRLTTQWIRTTKKNKQPTCLLFLPVLAVVGSVLLCGVVLADGWQDFSPDAKFAVQHAVRTTSKRSYETIAPTADGKDVSRSPLLEKDIRLASSEVPSTCLDTADDCQEELDKLRADTLASINLDIHVTGVAGNDFPCECRLEGEDWEPRQFVNTTMTWRAAGYCHKPLYFEQWNFERYGNSVHPVADPFLSAGHFFTTAAFLPYKMGVELPWECIYPLGYYRPGDCAPWTVPAPAMSLRGAALEAAALTGAYFILPFPGPGF
ncbi:MAG: hypothetical protein ISQ10_08380 [Planctomycetes bacterium]|nr:hypothetical protein [Planctomycetota bacterium]